MKVERGLDRGTGRASRAGGSGSASCAMPSTSQLSVSVAPVLPAFYPPFILHPSSPSHLPIPPSSSSSTTTTGMLSARPMEPVAVAIPASLSGTSDPRLHSPISEALHSPRLQQAQPQQSPLGKQQAPEVHVQSPSPNASQPEFASLPAALPSPSATKLLPQDQVSVIASYSLICPWLYFPYTIGHLFPTICLQLHYL